MRSRLHWLLIFTAATAAACGSDTAPNDGNGGNGGGGAVGTVTVGNIFFRSGHNGTQNPAVDTVAAGTTVTWTWTGTGSQSHTVQSLGDPGFTSSGNLTGNGMTYTFMFTTPGTYQYNCAIHGNLMTGTIVVQ